MVVIIKSTYSSDIRSFVLPSPRFSFLHLALCSMYSLPTCTAKYQDQDGDWVTLTSTGDLRHALASAEVQAAATGTRAVLRIHVSTCTRPPSARHASPAAVRVEVRSRCTTASTSRTPLDSAVFHVHPVTTATARLGRRAAAPSNAAAPAQEDAQRAVGSVSVLRPVGSTGTEVFIRAMCEMLNRSVDKHVPARQGLRAQDTRTTVSSPRDRRMFGVQRCQNRQLRTVKTLLRRTAGLLTASPAKRSRALNRLEALRPRLQNELRAMGF